MEVNNISTNLPRVNINSNIDFAARIPSQKKDYVPTHKELESAFPQSEIKASANIDRSIFTLFKLSDGKIYSRVRNLDTGQIDYYPALENFYYNQFTPQKGVLIETLI